MVSVQTFDRIAREWVPFIEFVVGHFVLISFGRHPECAIAWYIRSGVCCPSRMGIVKETVEQNASLGGRVFEHEAA